MKVLADFLDENPQYEFNINQHLFDSRYISLARQRHDEFVHKFRQEIEPSKLWSIHEPQLSRVISSVPAWRDWSLDASHSFLTKSDLREQSDLYLQNGSSRDCRYYRETSGTTGPPTRIYYAPEFAIEGHYFRVDKMAMVAGVIVPDNRSSNVHAMVIGDQHYVASSVTCSPDDIEKLLLTVMYDSRRSESIEAALHQLSIHQPLLLLAKPNVLERVISHDAKIPKSTEAIFCSGSNLSPELQAEAQTKLGKPIYNAYGMSEIGMIAVECHKKCGLHIFEHTGIFEVLKSGNSLSFDGEGELVITSSRNRMMPIVRYKTGDLVEVTAKPCACGVPGRRITKLSGRIFEDFKLPSGLRLSPVLFNRLFDVVPMKEFRLSQIEPATFELEIQPDAAFDSQRDHHQLSVFLDRVLGPHIKHKVLSVENFEAVSKFERFRKLF